METVGTPYSLANGCPGDLAPSAYPHHPAMGPALTPTGPPTHPAAPSALPNGTPTPATPTTTPTTTGAAGPGMGPGNVGAHSCCGCGRVIQDRFLLFALNHYWHTGCLKCTCCQAQLGEIGKSCFERNNMILCRNDYIRLFGSEGSCQVCRQKIPPSELVFRVHLGQNNCSVYHLKCFVCVTCRQPLQPGDRYGLVNGSLLCEQDYPKAAKGQGGHVPLPARTSHKVC